jgi:predicted DNA binding CopG/RHH family protein
VPQQGEKLTSLSSPSGQALRPSVRSGRRRRKDLTSFEFEPKSAVLNMRLPEALLEAVKAKAAAQGIPFTRYIRMLMEEDLPR